MDEAEWNVVFAHFAGLRGFVEAFRRLCSRPIPVEARFTGMALILEVVSCSSAERTKVAQLGPYRDGTPIFLRLEMKEAAGGACGRACLEPQEPAWTAAWEGVEHGLRLEPGPSNLAAAVTDLERYVTDNVAALAARLPVRPEHRRLRGRTSRRRPWRGSPASSVACGRRRGLP